MLLMLSDRSIFQVSVMLAGFQDCFQLGGHSSCMTTKFACDVIDCLYVLFSGRFLCISSQVFFLSEFVCFSQLLFTSLSFLKYSLCPCLFCCLLTTKFSHLSSFCFQFVIQFFFKLGNKLLPRQGYNNLLPWYHKTN